MWYGDGKPQQFSCCYYFPINSNIKKYKRQEVTLKLCTSVPQGFVRYLQLTANATLACVNWRWQIQLKTDTRYKKIANVAIPRPMINLNPKKISSLSVYIFVISQWNGVRKACLIISLETAYPPSGLSFSVVIVFVDVETTCTTNANTRNQNLELARFSYFKWWSSDKN